MNRYNASTGRWEYVPDASREPARPAASPLPPTEAAAPSPSPPPPRPSPRSGAEKPSGPLRELGRGLDGILSRLDPGRLETEDLLVLAILWLLYRESGDREMLIALAAYLFL